jgi:hypothetical protein
LHPFEAGTSCSVTAYNWDVIVNPGDSLVKHLLAITATALLSTAAFAQEGGRSPFDILDADHNGGINQQEAQAHPTVAQAFTAADADGNGAITREEFNAAFTTSAPPAASPAPGTPPQE